MAFKVTISCALIFLLSAKSIWGRMFERRIHQIEAVDNISYGTPWVKLASTEKKALQKLVKILQFSSTGQKIVAQAQRKAAELGHQLFDLLQAGPGSLTDTTLTRKFLLSAPDRIVYQFHFQVFINRHLSVLDGVLDMAHELTHFTLKRPFNPYIQSLNLGSFIAATIEGKGGEVDAYIMECQVKAELLSKKTPQHCQRAEVVKAFYQVGRHYEEIHRKLKHHRVSKMQFDEISPHRPRFISSAYELPYPMAAVYEYEAIVKRICQNDRQRIKLIRGASYSREDSSRCKTVSP